MQKWMWARIWLRFDPDLTLRGLIMDKKYGNLIMIKVDRFG